MLFEIWRELVVLQCTPLIVSLMYRDVDKVWDEGESREADQTDANDQSDDGRDETKRFERSDNLRRRSEWFQKRTGGGE